MLELFCATSNRDKLREFRLAAKPGIRLLPCRPVDCPETGESFVANAVQKAHCYFSSNPAEWLFADDSGLEVDALNGAPGIRSARFAGEGATELENNRLLLRRLSGVPRPERSARFVCAIALLRHGKLERTFRGTVEGLVLRRHSGMQGFGYDPLFYFPAEKRSFGLLPPERKWKFSHRGKAFRAMLEFALERS